MFWTSHSMMSLEMFYRAGGLVCVYPILDPSLSMFSGGLRSTFMERLLGYADALLRSMHPKPGSVIIIVSNSDKNAVLVEIAVSSRMMGLRVIGVTSLKYSMIIPPENIAGKKLYEVADVIIDNKVSEDDVIYDVKQFGIGITPISTIINVFIAPKYKNS